MVDATAPGARRELMNVRVGVGVIVRAAGAKNKIYAGIRKGSHGAGSLALPGGHLELYESWEDCAKREVMEEMGIELADIGFAHVTNDIMKSEGKHYVTIFMMGTPESDCRLPRNMEPDKCEGWEAYTWEQLKQISRSDGTDGPTKNLFGPLAKLVQDEPQTVLDFLQQK